MTPTKRKRRRPTLGYVLRLERRLMAERMSNDSIRKAAGEQASRCLELQAKLDGVEKARQAIARWLGVEVPR